MSPRLSTKLQSPTSEYCRFDKSTAHKVTKRLNLKNLRRPCNIHFFCHKSQLTQSNLELTEKKPGGRNHFFNKITGE